MRSLAAFAVAFALTLGAPLAMAAGPQVLVAHRGTGNDANQIKTGFPENSILGLAWSVQNGADIADMDVAITRDGVQVLMHDDTLNRTTNGSGKVRDRDWSYIHNLWLELPIDRDGNGNDDNTTQHVPSASAALNMLKNKLDHNGQPVKVALEMKGGGWTQGRANALKSKLAERGMLERTMVHAFSLSVLSMAKTAGIPNRGYVVPSGDPLPSVSTVKAYGSNVLINHNYATEKQVDSYNTNNIKVWLWTMDTTTDYNQALAMGDVYAWVVDDLRGAQEYLEGAT